MTVKPDGSVRRKFLALLTAGIGFALWLASTIAAFDTDSWALWIAFIATAGIGGLLIGVGLYRFTREWYA